MVQASKGRANEGAVDLEETPIDADEQLALADGEERLPWLESDDDYEPAGNNSGRIVAFAAVGLLAVVLAVGVLWWVMKERPDSELVADGSVIEAPAAPYRTAPANPGGRQVEGTGDTSFEVAEGETVDGRIAGSGVVPSAAPSPSIDREQADAPAAAPSASPGSIGVQVGAYSSRSTAETGWSQLSGRIEALKGRSHRIVQGAADSGTIYRLQALAGTGAEADTLCRAIKSQGGDCQVKR